MNVLVIGSGGREHALTWALKRSSSVKGLWCAPGNPGMASLAPCVSLDPARHEAVLAFAREKEIGLAVIGPEAPLVDGLSDALRRAGVRVFGPDRAAARLEGSKVFAKKFMKTHRIPTADFTSFSRDGEAADFVKSARWPSSWRVVKADGLAAGKGVMVCPDRDAVLAALDAVLGKKAFGAAGNEAVLEETLEGEELSVMALCDGRTLLPLVPSQDHKRVFDDDKGPNTGGMGAYAPVPQVSDVLWKRIEREIFSPFLKGLAAEKLDYCGVIYFGLMLTQEGPKVLEFNVRFGDPETQVVVPLIENDWGELMAAAAEKRLDRLSLKKSRGAALCVVLASGGYPGAFEKGKVIEGLESLAGQKDVLVFHAGTARPDPAGPIRTAGGRVLAVTALAADLEAGRRRAYEAVGNIRFEGAHHRRDIGARALRAPAR